jgi:hypothetical protein
MVRAVSILWVNGGVQEHDLWRPYQLHTLITRMQTPK